MLQRADTATDSLVVEGTRIDLIERGKGRPVLFLHAENGIEPAAAAIDALAKAAHVIAPTHPGFGRSELPSGMHTVDDLSYFYLDLLDQLDLGDVTLVGVAFGAWIAADIADIFALTEAEYLDIAYSDPNAGRRDYKTLPAGEVLAAARAREATARFAWSPYFHNPRLKSRLHRIRIPTLFLWGTHDRMVGEAYGRAYCAMIPGARFETIERAGHFPHQEQPRIFVDKIMNFMGGK